MTGAPNKAKTSKSHNHCAMPLEQNRIDRNRQRRSDNPVNLLYSYKLERIHSINRNRVVPINPDPL